VQLPPCAAPRCSVLGRQELGLLGHRLSRAGVSVDQSKRRKVHSIVEWATPTSCTTVLRSTDLATYYHWFV
jgi:hypothetical protein